MGGRMAVFISYRKKNNAGHQELDYIRRQAKDGQNVADFPI